MGLLKYAIIATVIVAIGLGIWAGAGYTSKYYEEKQLTLTVSRTWTDTERSGENIITYYLVGGKDNAGKDRVIEIVSYKGKNVDVTFGSLITGVKYNFVCYGEENLSVNYYYRCTTS